jgi:hypothetical protein
VSFSGVRIKLPDAMAVPIPGSIVTVVAPVVSHSSVVLSPAVTAAGFVVKVRITGSGTVVFVTAVLRGTHPVAGDKTSARATPAITNLLRLDIILYLIELYVTQGGLAMHGTFSVK